MATSDSNEEIKTKKKDQLDALTVDKIKKEFNCEPSEQIIEIESCKVKIYNIRNH